MSTPLPVFVRRVALEGIRGFDNLDLSLPINRPSGPRTVILGKNGTCKTTLLRSVALGLCDQSDAGSLLAEDFGGLLAEDSAEGKITLDLGVEPILTGSTISRIGRSGTKEEILSVRTSGGMQGFSSELVCGYGAGRAAVGTDKGREYRIRDSVASLFDYRQELIEPELTLRRLKDFQGKKKYETTMEGIKTALGLSKEDEIRLRDGGGVEIVRPSEKSEIPLQGWADGYRVTFSWLLDLFAWAMRANCFDAEGNPVGIVLVDELEQHLHPSMQLRLLDHISEILPKVQLIVTTHSPQVALSARPEEVVVLKRQGTQVTASTFPSIPDFSGYSAEDMLVDKQLFDSDVYKPETSEKLRRYNELVRKDRTRRSPKEAKELRELARELQALQLPEARGSGVSEELTRLLAKHGL